MTDKELAISETIRLIKTNHKVEDNIELILSEIYDLGYHLGTLRVKCNDHKKHPDYISFDTERDVEHRALETHPLRIANKRNLKYIGTEIGSHHLICDMTYNQALREMSCDDFAYRYFDSNTGDEKEHLERIKYCYSDEEMEYEYGMYNELEVRILFCKLFQVSESVACNETYEMSKPVEDFFSYIEAMESMKAEGIEVDNMERRIIAYRKEIETNYPDYKDWEQYYFKRHV